MLKFMLIMSVPILHKRQHSAFFTPFQSKKNKSKHKSHVTSEFLTAALFQLDMCTVLVCLALQRLCLLYKQHEIQKFQRKFNYNSSTSHCVPAMHHF